MMPLRKRNTNAKTVLPITYADLGNAEQGGSVELTRPLFKGIKLTVISTWASDGATHQRHLDDAHFFLLHGNDQSLRRTNVKASPPCNTGIDAGYIDAVFAEHREELNCVVSVWGKGRTGDRYMVTTFVFKELGPVFPGLGRRLYLWMVCGRFPKAFKLGIDHAKKTARAHGYNGMSLTASKLQLIPTYRKYGFDVTPNACSSRRRGRTQDREYRDRARYFMCEPDIDCSLIDKWTDNLLEFAAGKTTPTFPPGASSREKSEIAAAFYADAETRITDDPQMYFPPGDGIFMDLCLSAV